MAGEGDARPWLIQHLERSTDPAGSEAASALASYLEEARSIPVFFVDEVAYDFIVSDRGLHLFRPPDPRDHRDPRLEILRQYTYRQTGEAPMILPGVRGATTAPTRPSRVQLPTGTSGEPLWQVPGAVYRAVMNEFPRVVATIWYEDAANVESGDYRSRYETPGDRGLRSIFAERLETSLPPAHDMLFEAGAAEPEGYGGPWDLQEVMITDRGFHFPSVGAPPSLDTLLTEIASGTAANPVFTSTYRTTGTGTTTFCFTRFTW